MISKSPPKNSKNSPVALVTGASAGLGKDISQQLAGSGYRVIAAARRVDRMAPLKKKGVDVRRLDITDEDSILKLVKHIKTRYRRIDVLINNAGYGEFGAVEMVALKAARRQFEVNLFGLASLTKKVIPLMRKQGVGKIINVSSIAGKVNVPLAAWYHSSKHALEGWSDCLRIELEPHGVTVVIIEPGIIHTKFGAIALKSLKRHSKGTPYEDYANRLAMFWKGRGRINVGSRASVITKLTMKAVKAEKPRTRYVGGRYAKSLLFIRRFASDRIFDKIITNLG